MEPFLPQDRLEVYRLSLELIELVARTTRTLPPGHADTCDQLRRSASSVSLNIAEGSGEFSPKEKSRIYRIALRSAAECGGGFDVLHRFGAITADEHRTGRHLSARIVAMMTALCKRQVRGESPDKVN